MRFCPGRKPRNRKKTCASSSGENISVRYVLSSIGAWRNCTRLMNFWRNDLLTRAERAYYLMAIHENLTRIPKHELQKVGWSKATELAKVARKDRESFDCATWLHNIAKELPKERFKSAVERPLSGKETEPWEMSLLQGL